MSKKATVGIDCYTCSNIFYTQNHRLVHYYEGYPIEDVVLPARLMKMMGAEILFLTNASGGVNDTFQLECYFVPHTVITL